MGASASVAMQEQEARRRSRSIDDSIAADKEKQARTVKILMLGACDAGKSTLAKQVRLIHDKGFSDVDKTHYRNVVRANLATSLLRVLEAMRDTEYAFTGELVAVADKLSRALNDNLAHLNILDLKLEVHMLVGHANFHRFLETSDNIGLAESTQYFFKSVDRILSPSFMPTDYDILRARQKNLGLAETVFHFRGFHIRLCDVDGTSTLKKKWLDCFETVSAVLFTVGLDTYDVRSKENDDKTDLVVALDSLSVLCRHPSFAETPFILFLNKRDIFRSKLKVTPLSAVMPAYKGSNDYTEAAAYVKKLFEQQSGGKKNFWVHVTCAIDTASVRGVFDSVLSVIFQSTLEEVAPKPH
ncbi:G protein alpha i subunit-like [Pomacea canaliculata]|uniref:G protein alpha i subunit-like n=1 Tax=Pomacea canaliculata TaxID=400727 RepID=UPI000D73D48F|nr:G protein alpha i subunit-like [Pomacea canaliculata]XP_025113634.1 G protein alpha i subunit-like [Pomacea canaliculata]